MEQGSYSSNYVKSNLYHVWKNADCLELPISHLSYQRKWMLSFSHLTVYVQTTQWCDLYAMFYVTNDVIYLVGWSNLHTFCNNLVKHENDVPLIHHSFYRVPTTSCSSSRLAFSKLWQLCGSLWRKTIQCEHAVATSIWDY